MTHMDINTSTMAMAFQNVLTAVKDEHCSSLSQENLDGALKELLLSIKSIVGIERFYGMLCTANRASADEDSQHLMSPGYSMDIDQFLDLGYFEEQNCDGIISSPQSSPPLPSPTITGLSWADSTPVVESATMKITTDVDILERFKLFKNKKEFVYFRPASRDLFYKTTAEGFHTITEIEYRSSAANLDHFIHLPKEHFPEVHYVKSIGRRKKEVENVVTPGTNPVVWWKAQFLYRPNCSIAAHGHNFEFFRPAWIVKGDQQDVDCHQAPMKKPCEIDEHLAKNCSRKDLSILKQMAPYCVSAAGRNGKQQKK